MTKIYVVIVRNAETGVEWAACEWSSAGGEDMPQEVFFDKIQAQHVFDRESQYGAPYKVSLHEFEV